MVTSYYAPTHVLFGQGATDNLITEIKALQSKKVLIHYGSSRIEKDGLLTKVTDELKKANIEYLLLSGVVPNPRLSLVYKGIELCKKEGVDLLLAIGGGSVIDSCKAIAYGAKDDGDVWDFYLKKRVPTASMNIGCILTQAAAGSEMSDSSVITNEATGLKRGYNSDLCRLKFALLDPSLTYSLPPYQTACATVDIMMHTMERFFVHDSSLQLTDELALSLIKTVMEAGKKALAEPCSYEARANLMWASSLSHNGLMAIGNSSRGDWAPHQMEHELSGMFDVAHGAGLAAIWSTWARYVADEKPSRFTYMGMKLFNLSPNASAEDTIKKMEEYFLSINMPITIKGLGVNPSANQIEELAYKCSFENTRTVGDFKKLKMEDMKAIYTKAL